MTGMSASWLRKNTTIERAIAPVLLSGLKSLMRRDITVSNQPAAPMKPRFNTTQPKIPNPACPIPQLTTEKALGMNHNITRKQPCA